MSIILSIKITSSSVSENNGIIITTADKGNGILIIKSIDYLDEMKRLFSCFCFVLFFSMHTVRGCMILVFILQVTAWTSISRMELLPCQNGRKRDMLSTTSQPSATMHTYGTLYSTVMCRVIGGLEPLKTGPVLSPMEGI